MGSQTVRRDAVSRPMFVFVAGVVTALIVGILALQAWRADAAGDEDATYVPMAPCRLVDQRKTTNGPMGPGETREQQVTGAVGDCLVPSDAVAVALNVTIAQPTATSFLTVFPANLSAPPTASNLNWTATSSPTPNKVDVQLSPDGKVKFFNDAGDVAVIADVVGFYTRSSLEAAEAALAELSAAVDELNEAFQAFGTAEFDDVPTATISLVSSSAPDGVNLSITRAGVGEYTLTATGVSGPIDAVFMITPFGDELATEPRVCSLGTPTSTSSSIGIDIDCFGPSGPPDEFDDGDPADASFQFLIVG